MKRFLLMMTLVVSVSTASAQITGQWTGKLKVGGFALTLNFNFSTDDAGNAICKLDSPDQNAFGLPCSVVSLTDTAVKVESRALMATYSGELKGDSLVGAFEQRGANIPLTLHRNAAPQKPKERAQTPQPPFPYTVKDVEFVNPSAGIVLSGTLTIPDNAKNVPAVVMITGSGAQDRDESVFGHRPFAVIADHLTRQGIAVLRFDDRGTGKSGGKFSAALTSDFAADARAAFGFLASQPGIDKKKMGYIGHSEGGQISFMNAAADSRVAFIVALAAPAIKGAEVMIRQNEMVFEAATGMKMPEAAHESVVQMFDAIASSNDTEALRSELKRILCLESTPESQRTAVERQIESAVSPWYVGFVKSDPSAAIKATKCAVLALGGSNDVQVEASTNLAAIKALCGSKSVTTKEYPGMNHLFQKCASPKEGLNYGEIEQTIAPEVLTDISTWLLCL